MEETFSKETQSKKIEELHYELQGWKSKLHFIKDEIIFIGHLLDSYAFQPNTPNLFERLQDYQSRLRKVRKDKAKIEKSIAQHENKLGGMIECTDTFCDLQYYQKHNKLKAETLNHFTLFRELKSEIFNYAGAILKKRKPTSDTKK